MKRILSVVLALCLAIGTTTQANAASGGPCIPGVIEAVEKFLTIAGESAYVFSTTPSVGVVVPVLDHPDLERHFLNMTKEAGFTNNVKYTDQAAEWFRHAGFDEVPSGSDEFRQFERPKSWNADKDGCGPQPPLPPPVAPRDLDGSEGPNLEGYGTSWAITLAGLAGVAGILILRRKRQMVPAYIGQ